MSESLFLDPFAIPTGGECTPSGSEGRGSAVPSEGAPGEVVPGTVVSSGPAAAAAAQVLTTSVPLDLDQAVGAFVDDTHLWWPRDLRATGVDGHVYFGDGGLAEESSDGSRGAVDARHEWARLVGATEGTLELDWLGLRQDPDPSAVRLYVSWSAGERGGTELTVRGNDPARWLKDWTTVLGAFARFTGGRLVEPGEGS